MDAYMNFVRKAGAEAKWVTSVCLGGLILGAAGLLDGYKATTHWAYLSCPGLFPGVRLRPRDPHKKNQEHPRWGIDRNRVTGGRVRFRLAQSLEHRNPLKGQKA